jgi:hypothetical protein
VTPFYTLLLFAHSYVRWALLIGAVMVTARAFSGWRAARPWTKRHQTALRFLVRVTDVQLVIGVLLYLWSSPISAAFFADPRHTIHDHVLRFFGVEHVTMMLIAAGVLHAGWRRVRGATSDVVRHRTAARWTGAFLTIVCTSVPWPGLRHGRPLFRTEAPGGAPHAGVAPVCPPVYGERCALCHGASGRADGIAGLSLKPRPRNFADAAWQTATNDQRIHDVVHDGGVAHGLSAAMPAQQDLGPADLEALTKCIRSFARTK